MALKRLDALLCDLGLCKSREQAQGHILAGEVWSQEQRLEKPGSRVDENLPLEIRARSTPFVSRAGQKLQHALSLFQISVTGRVCLDVGASTGGFTDCLLKQGARHVFAVDVGYGQLDVKLRSDARVTMVERVNARFLSDADLLEYSPLANEINFACMDLSFISLRKVIAPMLTRFPPILDWVLLFKPQFEVGREHIKKGGVVKDDAVVADALADFGAFMSSLGFILRAGPESSPLTGKKSGNLEYLVHYAFLSKDSP